MIKRYRFDFLTSKVIALFLIVFIMTGCVGFDSQPSQDFRVALDNARVVEVIRDGKSAISSSAESQDCPMVFYINNKKVGHFAIYQQDDFYLVPDVYTFRVKNCKGRSSFYSLEVTIWPSSALRQFVLSLDGHGQPLIIEKVERTQ